MRHVKRALALATGSRLDDDVVSLACDLARPSRGRVWVLYVIEFPLAISLEAEIPLDTVRGEQTLRHMEQIGRSLRCEVRGEIVQARAAGVAAVQTAAKHDSDVIVAGMPYTERYGSPALGETVPYLLRCSPCRVVVYRAQQLGGAPVMDP